MCVYICIWVCMLGVCAYLCCYPGDSATRLGQGIHSTLHRVVDTGEEKFSTVFKLKGRPEKVGPRNTADYFLIDNHTAVVSICT